MTASTSNSLNPNLSHNFVFQQYPHLGNGNLVEAGQAFRLAEPFFYKHSIEIFQIDQANQLGGIGEIPNIAFFLRVLVSPLFGGHPEQGHIQHIRLAGVDQAHLLARKLRGNQVGLDRIGVNPVIDLELQGEIDLAGLEQVIDLDAVYQGRFGKIRWIARRSAGREDSSAFSTT